MNNEKHTEDNSLEGVGVQDEKIENNHYIVTVVWKDGKKNNRVFPENGFNVFDPVTKERLGFISGEKAASILREHASEYDSDSFSWIPFIGK